MKEKNKENKTIENFNHLGNQKVGNLSIEVWNNILRQRNGLEQEAKKNPNKDLKNIIK